MSKVAGIDILRTAKLLIQQHGVGAWLYAATRYHELAAASDVEGARVWRIIAELIARWDGAPTEEANGSGSLH